MILFERIMLKYATTGTWTMPRWYSAPPRSASFEKSPCRTFGPRFFVTGTTTGSGSGSGAGQGGALVAGLGSAALGAGIAI